MKSSPSPAYTLSDLVQVMARLRDPETGCPWDKVQDFRSIVPYTIEEAYEVADAIDRGDMANLREELGDLLLQSVYHAQMASEQGLFTLHDVVHDITVKMIERHPHVFGNENAATPEDVNKIWDEKKRAKTGKSALDGVPSALPSLLRAQKLQKKAAKVGFEWPDLGPVLDKLEEEIGELREALKVGPLSDQEEELGDVLFVLANFARMQGMNAEEILRQACVKFEKRFRGMEADALAAGRRLPDMSLEEMEALWVRQKGK